MQTLLVPTDFSNNTHTALEYAIDLANHFSCKLILFNTYKLQHRAGMFIGVEQLMRGESRNQMADLLKKTRKKLNSNVILEGKVAKGEAVSTIIRAAKKLETNLIVMATQGASGLKEVFIGSTTNGVMTGSKIPVLVVPSKFDYCPFRKIALYVYEEMKIDKNSVEVLKVIASRYNASVSAFYANVKNDNEVNEIKKTLTELLDGIKFSIEEIEMENLDINKVIGNFVKEENADMVCMVKRDRGFWGNLFYSSVTTKEVFHSTVPILVLYN